MVQALCYFLLGVIVLESRIKSLSYIVFGNVLIAFALSTLLLENNIIVGGVTGFGRVLNYFTGINITLVVYIANVTLFLCGLYFMGKKFALTTLVSTFLFPFLLEIFQSQSIFHHYCRNVLLACVLAGLMIGIGIGLVIKANASTGGVDIIAIILNRKFKIPVFITLNIIDLCMLVLQMSFTSIINIVYGLIVVFLCSFMVNKTLTFEKQIA